MDGMLYASVVHPPVYGGTVKSVDDAATLKVAGVKQTVTMDPVSRRWNAGARRSGGDCG